MATIRLDSVRQEVDGRVVLDDVTLDVVDGELLVLVGRSGSGKTSLLRLIAGLGAKPTAGSVSFDGVDVTELPPEDRDVTLVFQEGALFPSQTARDNVAYPLTIRSLPVAEVDRRVTAEARALDIERILDRWPRQLADGHRQLVEIARAIVRVPRVLLLDEPMSRLDGPTRARLRVDLRQLQQGYGVTTVYAANDAREAMSLADRIAVISGGSIVQIGSPEDVFHNPVDMDAAWLTGSLALLVAAVERARGGGYHLVTPEVRLRSRAPALEAFVGSDVTIGIRPGGVVADPASSDLAQVAAPTFESGAMQGRVVIGGEMVPVRGGVGEPGSRLPVRVDSYLVFDPAGRLIVAIG